MAAQRGPGAGLFDLIEPLDRILKRNGDGGGAAAAPGGANLAGESTSAPHKQGGPAPAPDLVRARFAAFAQIGALLTTPRLEFDEAVRTVLDVVIRNTRAERGFLILVGESGELEIELARNDREEPLDPGEFAFSRSIVGEALASRKPVFLRDVTAAAAGFAPLSESIADLRLRSAMCVPLHLQGGAAASRRRLADAGDGPEVLGAIYVDSSLTTCAPFTAEDQDFLMSLASLATSAILMARLYYEATTDPLSRLYTRWHLQRLLAEAARRAEARHAPFSLLLIDIDDFKLVNDRFGHVEGDQAIREVSAAIKSAVRADDACFRYGGEEFAVLLPDADRAGAATAAEKVRAAVAKKAYGEPRVFLTVSIGYASVPEHTRDVQDLVKKADQALYHAKEEKDRVRAWTEEIGAAGKRKDRLAGIVTGDFASDYKNIDTLIDTIATINATNDLTELLTVAVDKVISATGAERGALMLAQGARGRLATIVARDRRKRSLPVDERFSHSVPEKVLLTGASVCVVDATEGGGGPASAPSSSQSVSELELRTIMCVPLATKDATIGVIYVDSRAEKGEIRESNLPFFEGLARQVAFAIENARLRARLAYEGGVGMADV